MTNSLKVKICQISSTALIDLRFSVKNLQNRLFLALEWRF